MSIASPRWWWLGALAATACHGAPDAIDDAGIGDAASDGAPASATITATVDSTRFVTREHMLAAGEMQISGEPLAEAMGRDLGGYSRDHLPPDLYFDPSTSAAGRGSICPGSRPRSSRTSTRSSR